jgi:AcrR family transcriptional regulator
MSPHGYRLGRRQADVERTRAAIISSARHLVAELGPGAGVGKVAERAGVSRITVYNQFGSKAGLLEALRVEAARPAGPGPGGGADPSDDLRRRIAEACTAWAADPRLYRQLQGHSGTPEETVDIDRELAERLAAHDRLRPGCSIKEAEDVIGSLTSFSIFDRLHKGGRRSPAAVAEILVRMASAFLGEPRAV